MDLITEYEIREILPRRWEMFSQSAERLMDSAIVAWVSDLERGTSPAEAIPALDKRLAPIKEWHPEITDTEPREHLASVCKKLLERFGYSPDLTARSDYAASIWD